MGKKSRGAQQHVQARREAAGADAAEVGPRSPCPCGSGRRYKHCHGRADGAPAAFVARTFEALPGEGDWVALREIVPAATAKVRLASSANSAADAEEREHVTEVTVCSLLPMAMPAVVRADGSVWLGLQVQHNYGDVNRDLAHTLELALAAEPGTQIARPEPSPDGPRLQDLVDPEGGFAVTVHDGFDFWLADTDDPDGQHAAALAKANERVAPTRRLASVEAAYWTRMGDREFVRWVRPDDESVLETAFARLHAAGDDRLGDAGRLIGMFRAHGLLAPVWELPGDTGPDRVEAEVAAMATLIDAALADESPLTAAQRSARSGLASRQLTIR